MTPQHKASLRRFIGFTLCNTPGTLIELLTVWLLSQYLFTSYAGQYILAPVIAFECAVITNFTLFSRLVWRDRISGMHTRARLIRMLAFNLSASGIYLLRIGLIQVMGILWHPPVVLCDLASMLFSGLINFAINDRVIFAGRRKHRLLVSTLITLAYPWIHLRIKGRENIPSADSQRPVVYVCNHGFISGPVMAAVNLPDTFRPWVDSRMLDRDECYRNLYDTFGRSLHLSSRLRHHLIGRLRDIVIAVLRDYNPIPVIKDGSRQIMDTLKVSADTLASGCNLLIFPEHSRQSYHGDIASERSKADNELRTFYSGFAHLGHLYYQRTGQDLRFIPLYVDRKHRTMYVSPGITYHHTGSPRDDRQQLADTLFLTLSRMSSQSDAPSLQATS